MLGSAAYVTVIAKMEDNIVAGDRGIHDFAVAYFRLDEAEFWMLADFFKVGEAAGLQVIEYGHGGALGDEAFGQVAADEASAAENEDFFVLQVHVYLLNGCRFIIYDPPFAIYDCHVHEARKS
jgi:hypothetical protein